MKKIEDLIVLKTQWLNYKTYILVLESPGALPEILPGTFAEILVPNSSKVFLRRPFSIYDVDHQARTISFFIKVIGEGTRILGELKKGDRLNVIYPLGNAFKTGNGNRVLIVGGGSGVAPFLMLGKQLRKAGKKVTFLFGGRTADDIVLVDEFGEFGKVMVTTEDGSLGEKGLVTQHSIFSGDGLPFDQVYTCGPDPMMKAVGKIAAQQDIPCQVSLENTMACGFGACLCCITPTKRGNICVCTEGPVFDLNELTWHN